MSSVMVSKDIDRYAGRRHIRRNEARPVALRHRYVLDLHLAGHDPHEIKELSGYSIPRIYAILNLEAIDGIRQQTMALYDKEFETLFPEVIKAVRTGLASTDITEKLAAAKVWLKAHGKGTPKQGEGSGGINITAEDVVIQILNEANGGKRVRANAGSPSD